MGRFVDLTGMNFNRWTVISMVGRKRNEYTWLCSCACGVEKVLEGRSVRLGLSKSCGCFKRDGKGGWAAKRKAGYCPQYDMWNSAKQRAKKLGLPFTIQISDIAVIPEKCPLLGIVIKRVAGPLCDNSPSLDRKVPELGYTKENCWVISNRANRIKNNASLKELQLILVNLKRLKVFSKSG